MALGLVAASALGVAGVASAHGMGRGIGMNAETRAAFEEVRESGDKGAVKVFMEERRAEMKAHHDAVKAALEAGDYDSFVAALGDKAPEDLTEEKFAQMLEIHAAVKSGDKDKAKELADQYGLKRPLHGMKHMRMMGAERGGERAQR